MIKKYTAPFHLIQSVPSHLRVTMKGAPPNPMGTEYAAGISIHAPAKGATQCGRVYYLYCSISIHAPAKGATGLLLLLDYFVSFQSTLPRRERLGWVNCILTRQQFQSTLPRRERLALGKICDDHKGFQSTLPRRERLPAYRFPLAPHIISIHAPARGATLVVISLSLP